MGGSTTKAANGRTDKEAAARAKNAAVVDEQPLIQIPRLHQETMLVPISGTTPLIIHRFSEKAKIAMLHAAQGKRTAREPKDPKAEYEAAFYRLANGTPGFPASGFKQAMVGAARFYRQVKMTEVKQFIFVGGEFGPDGRQLVAIESPDEPRMREDVVRVARGGTDLRYRPEIYPWNAVLELRYFPGSITRDSVLGLLDAGGLAVGVGEWRPEKDGEFGTFHIDGEIEVKPVDEDAVEPVE